MCGFAGFVAYGGAGLDAHQRRHILATMGRALAHRGPDDQQFYDDGVLSLVFRRLTIMGSHADSQPIFNEKATHLLVCNGEIYNHTELKHTLSHKHHFTTQSDSEVLLHAYEEWGPKALESVRGMFATAIWDRQQQRLFLARDRLGIKPLYTCELPSGLLFGSELKALLAHPECPRQTDWSALNQDPLSLLATPSYVKGIEHLPGGTFLLAEPGRRPIVRKYWRLEDHIGVEKFGSNAQQYRSAYDQLIEEATHEHLQGQGPVGIHLSGGLDSALLTAIVGKAKHDAMCFTVVKRTTYLVGDVHAAQKIASDFGLPWHPVLFHYQDFLSATGFSLEKLEQSVWAMDSPLFDIEWIIKTELNRKIRTQQPQMKILLLGQGADEFAGGYSRRVDRSYQNWEQYLLQEIKPGLATNMRSSGPAMGHHTVFSGGQAQSAGIAPFHQWMQIMVRQLQHHNLWHEDRTSAMFGMEARVPFLDHRIVELLASIPDHLHAELFWNKQIVRDCMKLRAPNYDTTRHKVGFCWTNDSRSVEMTIHSMACLVSRDFQEKYVDAHDFPFDRDETMAMIRKVVGREPGFFTESIVLLSRITATIFNSLHSEALANKPDLDTTQAPSQLVVVRESQWSALQMQLESEPVMPFVWLDNHCISLPLGASIQKCETTSGETTCSLLLHGNTLSTISYRSTEAWVCHFFESLQRQDFQAYTVGEWVEELAVGKQPLLALLGTLLQCGFITTPTVAKTAPGAPPKSFARVEKKDVTASHVKPRRVFKPLLSRLAVGKPASMIAIGSAALLALVVNGID
jgi:asparagine synthase (glutamine-hydrolysing)